MVKKSLQVFIAFFVLPLLTNQAWAQPDDQVMVKSSGESYLSYPWAGGINAAQFGAIDLNLDGLDDLVVFDRHGDRKMCFINNGISNNVDYTYRPEYADLLPDLVKWAIFADYDGDGKKDIFTCMSGYGSMMVYKNISTSSLKFQLVVAPLNSLQGDNYINLYVSDVDYPGIADLDNDGDLDIVSFWVLGTFVSYHRNMSMEKYGTADSLDFKLEEYCWGNFGESDESNKIYLDTCFQKDLASETQARKTRHSGSTFLMLDFNQDSVLDLLLGDIDYPGLYALYNDGNKFNAHIGSYDTIFPATSEKVELYSFPAAAYIDVDNDDKKDLLVSPFDPTLESAENKHSVWYYSNSGSNDKPVFTLASKNFLQSEMIDRGSGAYPVLFDWNKDGLLDLFVGNFGIFDHAYYDNFKRLYCVYYSRIAYYQNTGTAQQPQFQLMDDDFGGLSALKKTGFKPAFADLDGDGDVDFLSGYDGGRLISVINNGENFDISDTNYMDIDVGNFSKPQFFDLNKDGLPDLIIGEEDGTLNFYQNTGNQNNPQFELVSDNLGGVNVTNTELSYTGYSVPYFFHNDLDETCLLVGSEDGLIFYFTNIDNNLDGEFTLSDGLADLLDTTAISFDRGTRTAVAIADISGDGIPEMIAGNYSGGLEYFNGNAGVSPGFDEYHAKGKKQLMVFPNPAQNEIHFQMVQKEINDITIEIITINGKIILNNKMHMLSEPIENIDISGLKNGIYIIKVIDNTNIYIGKFIVSKPVK
jgi:hypothetical protein